MTMQQAFEDTESAEAVRLYILNRGKDWIAYEGTDFEQHYKAMSLREMINAVLEHGTREDIQVCLKMLLPQFEHGDRYDEDPREKQRRDNIQQAALDFGMVPRIVLPPQIPEGSSFMAFDSAYHPLAKEGRLAVQDWMDGTGTPILILAGPPGGGKTHLAIAAATDLACHEQDVLFRREQDLVADLRERSLGDKSDQEALKEYGWCPWLILDEFGGARGTPLATESLDQLIDYRWRGAEGGTCRTLCTTNLFANDHEERIASRMGDTRYVRTVEMRVPDYRRAKR